MTGMELIALERARQIEEEGYPLDHDDGHVEEEMAIAAASLLVDGTHAEVTDHAHGADLWDLVRKYGYRAADSSRARALTIAGALVAAELDRVLRRDGPKENERCMVAWSSHLRGCSECRVGYKLDTSEPMCSLGITLANAVLSKFGKVLDEG